MWVFRFYRSTQWQTMTEWGPCEFYRGKKGKSVSPSILSEHTMANNKTFVNFTREKAKCECFDSIGAHNGEQWGPCEFYREKRQSVSVSILSEHTMANNEGLVIFTGKKRQSVSVSILSEHRMANNEGLVNFTGKKGKVWVFRFYRSTKWRTLRSLWWDRCLDD